MGHRTDFPSQSPSQTSASSPQPTIDPTQAPTLDPTLEPTKTPSEPPSEQPSQTISIAPSSKPSNAPSHLPTKIPTTRSPDAPPTVSPSLSPSEAPSPAPRSAQDSELSCYTYNITTSFNTDSSEETTKLMPCHPTLDAYCVAYATPAAFGGGTAVGACSPGDCLEILRSVPHVVFCSACKETACNTAVAVPVSGGSSLSSAFRRRRIRKSFAESVLDVLTTMTITTSMVLLVLFFQ